MSDEEEILRPAATLLLVRDGAAGLEVFMVRRPSTADFGGMYVFPGGKVDAADTELASCCLGLDEAQACARLGVSEGGLAYWVAAIRESFEEAGALLAYRAENPAQAAALVNFQDAEADRHFAALRHQVHQAELSLLTLCQQEGLCLATDQVHYFSHWITPKGVGRRYDTRFFVAALPPGQTTAHHAEELTDSCWVTPVQALQAHAAGHWPMIHPTLVTLRTIAEYPNVASLLQAVVSGHHNPEATVVLQQQGMQAPDTPSS